MKAGRTLAPLNINCFTVVAVLVCASPAPSSAQSIGYAQALDRLGSTCGKDIERFFKKVNLGGGRMTQCLGQNQAVSATCRASITEMQVLIATRAQARAAVLRVCDVDIRRFCPGVQPGDGNLMECFSKAKQSMSPQCRKTVADAGYEATIDASVSTTQVALSSTDLINSLQGVEQTGRTITAASLRQMAVSEHRLIRRGLIG